MVNDGIEKEFSTKRNKIVIEHKDGAFVNYKGLKKGSFIVKVSQEVYTHWSLGF